MLTTEEFYSWCQHLQFPKETEELIASIRSSSPVRKERGRANNVAGRYPSSKMQFSIQFESQHVELWAIYGMERDEDVLEYYDQPIRLAAPAPLVWDGRVFFAEVLGDLVTLRPEEGEALTLSKEAFQHLVDKGAVIMATSFTTPSPTRPEIREAHSRASPKTQQEANERLRQMLTYQRGEPVAVTPRSIQRWMAAYRRAEAETGCGYLGLLSHVAERRNRTALLESRFPKPGCGW
jgi:hypothetical protein